MQTSTAADRIFNFSAGPAVLPLPVLEQAQQDLLALPGVGASVLEISHRSPAFAEILASTKQRISDLLNLPSNYQVVFLQGGSRLQFSMIPMNLLEEGGVADYILTGSWGKKAVEEAQKVGTVNIPWDGKATNYDCLPAEGDYSLSDNSSYVHITSNETIQGVQFLTDLDTGDVPLVCDCSSDMFCRPLDVEKYGLIYACAQKNAGPAGVTVCIIRDDLLEKSSASLPGYMNYKNHADNDSLWNTPPTFGIYLMGLVAKWLQDDIGGLANMEQRNRDKCQLLYDVIDGSDGFFMGHAVCDNRSLMNVTFRLPSEELEKKFVAEAKEAGMDGLKGHRSVGGIRASIYNAMPVSGVEALRDFMQDFQSANS